MRNNEVKRSEFHVMEDLSKIRFEELMLPWSNLGWNQRDYGIDTTIEIYSDEQGTGDLIAESKFFMVQLKSTKKKKLKNNNISIAIPVKKILYWYVSNVPVLFVVHDQNEDVLYSIWIDESFINQLEAQNSSWSNKNSITVQFGTQNILEKSSKNELKKTVFNWNFSVRRVLESGRFFQLKDKSNEIAQNYESITKRFEFDSINSSNQEIKKNLDQSIYRIAITGLSRVGKSSFINKFLESGKKEISPTGVFQTTGVPIQIVPNSEEKLEIQFIDGSIRKERFTSNTIAQYASQEYNEDNSKNVQTVTISLRNNQLEKGVSIYDIPGLDDPDDNILSYTNRTIRKANAIIYLIDGSPMEHGGYIFSRQYKQHIEEFGKRLDRIFLVINKVDVLSNDNLNKLKSRVAQDIEKHQLKSFIGDKIYFISTTNNSRKYNSVEELREDIWSYMLSENKYGIQKLAKINQDIIQSVNEFSDLLYIRLANKKKKEELQSAVSAIQGKLPRLRERIIEERNLNYKQLIQSLNNRKNGILSKLEKDLGTIPLDTKLPNNARLKEYLSNGILESLDQMNSENSILMQRLKTIVDEWVEDNLKLIRNMIYSNSEKRTIYFDEIESYEIPTIEISPSVGISILGFVVGLVFNAPAMIFGSLLAVFGQALPSEEKRKAKIAKIVEEAKKRYDIAFQKIDNELRVIIDQNFNQIVDYVNNKLQLFFKDLNHQIESLETDLIEKDSNAYHLALDQLKELEKQVSEHHKKIENYLIGF